jgi:hypothetical protein
MLSAAADCPEQPFWAKRRLGGGGIARRILAARAMTRVIILGKASRDVALTEPTSSLAGAAQLTTGICLNGWRTARRLRPYSEQNPAPLPGRKWAERGGSVAKT